jgi:Cu(I)/Ag(I) efflux system protein CusF
VTRVDKAQGRVTLRHGEIRHLDMPPMTMVYRVADGKLLDGLAVGDRVRFAADTDRRTLHRDRAGQGPVTRTP